MPPAAPDDLIRQHSQSPGDDITHATDQNKPTQEHEPSTKTKKKGKGGKKNKGAKAATEDLYAPTMIADDHHHHTADDSGQSRTTPTIQASSPPHEPASCPDPSLDHHVNPTISSPVLDALGSLGETGDPDFANRTDTWAQSVPFGKSPPNDLIDGDIPSDSPLNFPTIQARAPFSHPSSASNPKPFSSGNGYRNSMPSRQQSIDGRKSHSYGSNQAPLPHLPQAHFYGAPDVDLLPASNRPTQDGSYSFCGFDVLPNASPKTPRVGMNVLLVGTDGSVEVLAVEDRRTRRIGQITGLNGRVIEAKIIPSTPDDPLAQSRPHVALIIHGPLPPNEEEGRPSSAGSEVNELPPSVAKGHSSDRRDIPFYQTRVEVYSLRTGYQVATLFATKPVPSLENIPGLPSFAPSPVGSLRLYISGNHIVLASGVSGEVYVYKYYPTTAACTYQCVGKTWTSIQSRDARRYSASSSSTDPDGSRADSPHGPSAMERPILAVQGRWLAIVPPTSTYRSSIQGTVPAHLLEGKVFGIETRNPPSMPSVNCATDVGEGESFLDKVARGVTQELVRGARWMGDQGLQAWNNYWSNQQTPGISPRRPTQAPEPQAQGYGLFPPTHAQDTQNSSTADSDIVSIIDLKRLDESASFHPLSTFQVPNGCSFLSLSPNGLMLLTASQKGDVQYVWDLMQLKNCRATVFMADDHASQSPNVRQVARYPRLTTSSIVDVIWTPPVGDRLAIITKKGTVHAFDLPRSAFQWPPFRRARPSTAKPPATDPTADDMSGQGNGGNPLSAAMKLVGDRTQPFFSAVRGRVPSSGTAFSNMSGFALPSAAGVKGGKVVAAGLSKSMGAATGTVNTLRHVGENRLHLSGLAREPAPYRVTWVCNKGIMFLGLVDDGSFKLYRLKRAASTQKHRQSHTVIGSKEGDFKLPAGLQTHCGPAPIMPYDPDLAIHASLMLPSFSSQPATTMNGFCQPLSQAEIETNTPYQPFHTDQRVGLHVFAGGRDSTKSNPSGQWVFGGDIPTTKLHVRSFGSGGDDQGDDEEDAAIHEHSLGAGGEMENHITLGNSTGNFEEVIITTRRKKKNVSTPLKADDGFFEDDCEVLDFARDRV
ncbi:uncharacterized protein PFLUO_LOCUS7129 [Penicillium psychrofluorescens]|uniref:uncharacterized protein n=1 Tax=Penicillium psychrofluorescens TaxID=3158075 RepID=UPI003CCD798E